MDLDKPHPQQVLRVAARALITGPDPAAAAGLDVKTDFNVRWDTETIQRSGQVEVRERWAMQTFRSHRGHSRGGDFGSRYRLIDSGCEPHRQLDGQYTSLEEAIADAIAWVEPLMDFSNAAHLIGVDVSTADGNWRTCRLPGALICPLLCPLPC